ncbi:ABC transporter permease [Labrys okinawensis]|uniref:ABC transporter permease n=1 Tax=Labrys okinawensis TaxID=346911 RepID=UPI0039BD45A2
MSIKRFLPADASIFLIFIGVVLAFELLGWLVMGQSFVFNTRRLPIIVLQVAVIGIIAIGVTQVIITGGIDLSSGSVAALSAMVAASFGQAANGYAMYFSALADLPTIVPLFVGIAVGCVAGWVNGAITAYTGVPPFIPTLGMMVSARGLAVLYNNGNPVVGLTDGFNALGSGAAPIVIFAIVALLFYVVLAKTLYGRRTYAIGSNVEAARVSGINVKSHKVLVYTIAGGLAGLAGVVMCARATMAQPGMGLMYELDAISAAVIGGTSLFGGRGRISGTVIGVLILGVITSGFTFLRIDFYYQEVAKGLIILAAVIADRYRQGAKFGMR